MLRLTTTDYLEPHDRLRQLWLRDVDKLPKFKYNDEKWNWGL